MKRHALACVILGSVCRFVMCTVWAIRRLISNGLIDDRPSKSIVYCQSNSRNNQLFG